jgi:hypothetical protein
MAYIAPTTHVTLLATIQRERLLPNPGEVMVNERQRVEATDIVARAQVADQHFLINVAQELGVVTEHADQYLVKENGQPVKKGEVLALRKTMLGLGSKRVASPVEGELIVAGEGKALLSSLSKALELRAGMPGTVLRVITGRGVVIETSGALLAGVWGNGKEDFAVMRAIGSAPNTALLTEQVDMSLRGTMVAVGSLQDTAAFKQMAEVRLRGLILGSLKADLIPAVQALDFPVMVTDGFGGQGFSAAAYSLLVSNTGREAWLNARPWDRFAGQRPEVIIPLPSPGQQPAQLVEGDALAPGKRVRIARGPQAGRSGTVVALSERALPIPGLGRARVATVEFDQLEEAPVKVPFANLEILE